MANLTLAAGVLKRLHVDRDAIAAGRPPWRVRCLHKTYRCNRGVIDGPSEMKWDPEGEALCGVRVFVSTHATVRLYGVENV